MGSAVTKLTDVGLLVGGELVGLVVGAGVCRSSSSISIRKAEPDGSLGSGS